MWARSVILVSLCLPGALGQVWQTILGSEHRLLTKKAPGRHPKVHTKSSPYLRSVSSDYTSLACACQAAPFAESKFFLIAVALFLSFVLIAPGISHSPVARS